MAIDRKYGILLMGLLLSLLTFSYLFSENKKTKKEAAPKSQFAFEASVNVVVVNAMVTDKDGNPVTDLAVNDFKVFDDGKLQEIQTFTLEFYGSAESQEKQSKPESKQAKASRNSSGSNAPQPRLITIFIDDLTMHSPSDLPYGVKRRLRIS